MASSKKVLSLKDEASRLSDEAGLCEAKAEIKFEAIKETQEPRPPKPNVRAKTPGIGPGRHTRRGFRRRVISARDC
jgi:hypothetical protein